MNIAVNPAELINLMVGAETLILRVKTLEDAIRTHRSQKADDRCIEDDDRLYETLGDGIKCDRKVGSQCEMLKNCERFIKNRTEEGEWLTYAELEEMLKLVRHDYEIEKDSYKVLSERNKQLNEDLESWVRENIDLRRKVELLEKDYRILQAAYTKTKPGDIK